METTKDMNNRKVYKMKKSHESVIFNVYCFLCGFIAAVIILNIIW